MTKECRQCEHTGLWDKTDRDGNWITVPCSCVEPKTEEYWQQEVAEIKEAIVAARNTVPAWRMV